MCFAHYKCKTLAGDWTGSKPNLDHSEELGEKDLVFCVVVSHLAIVHRMNCLHVQRGSIGIYQFQASVALEWPPIIDQRSGVHSISIRLRATAVVSSRKVKTFGV